MLPLSFGWRRGACGGRQQQTTRFFARDDALLGPQRDHRRPPASSMGVGYSHQEDADDVLRPEEVDELEALSGFKRAEITKLYRRFRTLDRDATGSLTKEDLLRVPEVAMNPMVNKILPFFGFGPKEGKASINFKEFVQALSQFNASRSKDEKLRLIFNSFDADADGVISHSELMEVLRTLVGSEGMEDADLEQLARCAIVEAGNEDGIDFDDFRRALKNSEVVEKMPEPESQLEAFHRRRDRELYSQSQQ
jgi:Ca2+-binding EF-hand superfamily protein